MMPMTLSPTPIFMALEIDDFLLLLLLLPEFIAMGKGDRDEAEVDK